MMRIKSIVTIFWMLYVTCSLKAQTKCDVVNYYKSLDVNSEVKVLTDGNDFEDAEYILIPTEIEPAKYSLTLTRKTSNLYKADGENIFIETRYCSEYSSYDDVILIVTDDYYTKGEVVFLE